MPGHGNLSNIAESAHIPVNLLGVFYLIEDRHILEGALALAMTVEIEPCHGDSVIDKAIGDGVEKRTSLTAHEAMTENNHRDLFALFQFRSLDYG